MSKDCIFCKIVAGELDSKKVYEDDHVFAFSDLHPVAPVHVLIVPKKHYKDMVEMTESQAGLADLEAIFLAIPKIAEQLEIKDEGFRVVNNCGKAGGQTVMHAHFHIIGGEDLGPKLR